MPVSPGIPFPQILSFGDTSNNDTRPIVESKNVRGGMVNPASSLAATYPGTDQQSINSIVPFQSLGFQGTSSANYVLHVATAGGAGAGATSWEPLADYLGAVGGAFQMAQNPNVSQDYQDDDVANTDHSVQTPNILRFGVNTDESGPHESYHGLTVSVTNEITDGGDTTFDTIRYGLTNQGNLATTYTAAEFLTHTGLSSGNTANVMAWSNQLSNGALVSSPITVSSDGTNYTTTIDGNLTLTGTLNYGTVVQANTLSVDDKFIVLNDGFTTEYDSIGDMTSSGSTGGILVQIGTVDDNDDGDVTDLTETKYKAFYWDAGTGNWSFADAVDADADGDGTNDGFTFSNINILASKTNIVDLHFGDTVATPSDNLEWAQKFVTPNLLSTYLTYNLSEATVDNNNATIPAVPSNSDNVLNLNTEGDTFVRYARIWHVQGQITQDIIDSKKMYINIPRNESDDYYAKPPVVQVYRSTTHGTDQEQNVREEVMTNIKIRQLNATQDRIEIFFAQWPGSAAGGLTTSDVVMVRILH